MRAAGDPACLKIELRCPGEAVATHHRYRSSCDVEEEEESRHLALSAPPARLFARLHRHFTVDALQEYVSDVTPVH